MIKILGLLGSDLSPVHRGVLGLFDYVMVWFSSVFLLGNVGSLLFPSVGFSAI